MALLGYPIDDARRSGWLNHSPGLNWNFKVQLRLKEVKYVNNYGEVTGPFEVTVTDKKKMKTVMTADKFVRKQLLLSFF
uniref:Thioredoxin reductase 1 (inferred by orthology to a C. elegans protein) n=1 Tax=Strongyloides venezuelensis TaxID=75913 RepID=A0A0K0FU77_STRVS